ncbi:MAG: invasion associated locus B family protein, partial [Alphaproteobacteria bacterium]|nr:invasion associated locus B family protein [Alphaproteobacteria bacterium]
SLFTEGDMAWAAETKTDQALVAALKKGNRMVVTGTSKRGTKTTDTYSLAGFTASHRAINLACNLE